MFVLFLIFSLGCALPYPPTPAATILKNIQGPPAVFGRARPAPAMTHETRHLLVVSGRLWSRSRSPTHGIKLRVIIQYFNDPVAFNYWSLAPLGRIQTIAIDRESERRNPWLVRQTVEL